jgi:hypothetical protein
MPAPVHVAFVSPSESTCIIVLFAGPSEMKAGSEVFQLMQKRLHLLLSYIRMC